MLKIKKILPIILIIFLFVGFTSFAQSTFYLDYENGDDVNDGSDWANAWKTLTLGATAARIAPGDTIRIAKSPAPSSIGNGEWTNLSKTVTLTSAQNATIDLCETAWTAGGSGDCTVTRTAASTATKEGSYCMKLLLDSSPQASTLQAYYATGELDLSGYQKISFWFWNSGIVYEDNWIVNLCSDVAGATPVDSFLIPAINLLNTWVPLTLTKVGGGNLGASIKSIAFYTGGTTTGLASKFLYLDNFIACTTSGLNLQSLISKNPLEQDATVFDSEPWHPIQSIDGVTVLIDEGNATKPTDGQGYYGASETVTTYKRETIKAVNATAHMGATTEDGAVGSPTTYSGGWNTSTTEQDGETFFDVLNDYYHGVHCAHDYIVFDRINYVRCNNGFNLYDAHDNIIQHCRAIGCKTNGIYIYDSPSKNNTLTDIQGNNNVGRGVYSYLSTYSILDNISAYNNGAAGVDLEANIGSNVGYLTGCNNGNYGISITGCHESIIREVEAHYNGYGLSLDSFNNIRLMKATTSNNTTKGIYFRYCLVYLNNWTSSDETPGGSEFLSAFSNQYAYVTNYGGDSTSHLILSGAADTTTETTDRNGGTGIMWKIAIASTSCDIWAPYKLSIAKVACVANKLVTVNVYVKKSHATNVVAELICVANQLSGIGAADIIDTKADDTDWEELEITFTPTQAGVVEIEVWTWCTGTIGDIYIEDMTITQAD